MRVHGVFLGEAGAFGLAEGSWPLLRVLHLRACAVEGRGAGAALAGGQWPALERLLVWQPTSRVAAAALELARALAEHAEHWPRLLCVCVHAFHEAEHAAEILRVCLQRWPVLESVSFDKF